MCAVWSRFVARWRALDSDRWAPGGDALGDHDAELGGLVRVVAEQTDAVGAEGAQNLCGGAVVALVLAPATGDLRLPGGATLPGEITTVARRRAQGSAAAGASPGPRARPGGR